jgi:hypothetical protein
LFIGLFASKLEDGFAATHLKWAIIRPQQNSRKNGVAISFRISAS